MSRSLRDFIIRATILAAALCLISIIWLPWYRGVIAVCGVVGVAWLVIRLMDRQWQKEEEAGVQELRRVRMSSSAQKEPIHLPETTRGK
jgi:Flp pilus assembly protein TadB